jgi:hypothetical protein
MGLAADLVHSALGFNEGIGVDAVSGVLATYATSDQRFQFIIGPFVSQ